MINEKKQLDLTKSADIQAALEQLKEQSRIAEFSGKGLDVTPLMISVQIAQAINIAKAVEILENMYGDTNARSSTREANDRFHGDLGSS